MRQKITKQFKISILRPGGNDTALIEGIVKKEERKRINDEVMKRFPNVEQVGFYSFSKDKNLGQLEMAGGEFCGNALRSLAYLLLNGKKGEIKFRVSGVNRMLKAGVNKKNTAYAQMPILKDFSSVKKMNRNLWLVDLEGISHLIKIISQKLNPKRAKVVAKRFLKETGLLNSKLAAGVMFIKESKFDTQIEIQPVVWVKDIETFFYETACASGTAAVGLWVCLQNNNQSTPIKVKQPSNEYIQVNVRKNEKQFVEVLIDGIVKILKRKGELTL